MARSGAAGVRVGAARRHRCGGAPRRSASLGVVIAVAALATLSALTVVRAGAPPGSNDRRVAGGAAGAACRLRPVLQPPAPTVGAGSTDFPCFSRQGQARDSRRAQFECGRRAPGA
jgi:hypothetical protein